MLLRNSFQEREAGPQSKPTCVLGKAVRSLGKAIAFSSDQFVRDLGVGHGSGSLGFVKLRENTKINRFLIGLFGFGSLFISLRSS